MTQYDIVKTVKVNRPETEQTNPDCAKKQGEDKLLCLGDLSWREKRIIALKGKQGVKQILKERGGISEIEFEVESSIGGQSTLEGASYFWFFTKLMLGTSILFVLVAFLYKPKEYLQEEVDKKASTA